MIMTLVLIPCGAYIQPIMYKYISFIIFIIKRSWTVYVASYLRWQCMRAAMYRLHSIIWYKIITLHNWFAWYLFVKCNSSQHHICVYLRTPNTIIKRKLCIFCLSYYYAFAACERRHVEIYTMKWRYVQHTWIASGRHTVIWQPIWFWHRRRCDL